jgi:L-ribulose-5-phosphate 4-epimerase
VVGTFGNASGIDEARRHVVIKASGVPYDALDPKQMVVVGIETGRPVEGGLKASTDAPTHCLLYQRFRGVRGIVHTHSLYATAWAQAAREIPALGTTHADYFHGAIPCTRMVEPAECDDGYEENTGRVIVERFRSVDPLEFPGVLVAGHGPFAWGPSVEDAVDAAFIIEFLAALASATLAVNPNVSPLPRHLLDKHFLRKHGPGAYYGQSREST